MGNFKVRFTQLREIDKRNFILNKVYDVKDGKIVTENGFEYKTWSKESDTFESFKKWFEYDGVTKVELVGENEIQNNKFTLSDLKDGMVITYRNGKSRYIFKKKFYDVNFMELTGNTFDDYNDDLTHNGGHYYEDIVKVEYMGELIWQREEKQYYTLEEAYNKANGKGIKHKDSEVYTNCMTALTIAMSRTGKELFEMLKLKEFEIEE